MAIDASNLRHGRVRGRYFRENFAQAGIDFTQIIPELVTNADAAIAAAGRERGRIQLRIGTADPEFLQAWKAAVRSLRVPALRSWHHELVCSDDGEGVNADVVDQRLGALGVEIPEHEGQRGLFGRGLRDVWLAQGGGQIQGVHGERAVETWFFPAAGDEPYVYTRVLDAPATPAIRRKLGISREGARVTVPLAGGRTTAATLACAGWCPTSSSCGRSSRTTAASCCSSFRASQPSSSATRLPSRTPSGHCCSTTRSSSTRCREWSFAEPLADSTQPGPRRPPRRAHRAVRASRARDDARRSRGPSGRSPPIRRGAV